MKLFALRLFIFIALVAPWSQTVAQDKPAYILYKANGKKTSFKRMMKDLEKADIVLFGEHHDNPISHWLQLEVVRELTDRRKVRLGAEMFEADNQEALTQYVQGQIDGKELDSLARLWQNYDTDYAPIVDLARDKALAFVATNVPRRYASQVYRGGFEVLDDLPSEEKSWIAPLPIPYDASLPGYQQMLTMGGGHGGENLPKAQALKDATMAHFILENYEAGSLFIHLNGAYHSDNYEGILWYLRQKQPNLSYWTITTVQQEDPGKLDAEYESRADFIIVVDNDMTRTYKTSMN
jgi:uncharacterized iron-regulated protein